MTCCQPYRPSSSRPHTYGVRPWSSSAIATEPCRPTACVCEHPCSPSREGGSALILNSAFLILNWTFTFSAKEKDSETGLSYFGSRYYSSDLSIWLSVDPMSDKYASLSPYVYCANNPVKLTDPDGRWIPGLDEDYNITVTKEEGDDFNSFKEFMGPGYSDEEIQSMFNDLQGDKINLTKSHGGVFQLMTNALNNAYGDPEFMDADNYNCWGAALSLTSGYELIKRTSYTSGSGINTEDKFDELLTKFYTQISPEMASVGKTVLRYGYTPDVAKHAAIYMGKDRSGNEYVFTKNAVREQLSFWTIVLFQR